MRETGVRALGWEDSLEKEMAIHSSTLPGKSHGQRSLVGYSLWGRKESGTTERLHFQTEDLMGSLTYLFLSQGVKDLATYLVLPNSKI